MDKIVRKIDILREKVKSVSAAMNGFHEENKKLIEINERLLTRIKILEGENKMVKKFAKEKDIVKNRIEGILENINRAGI
ncbi:MAG: hypothetical protein ABID79_03410 [Elusimicrobiota bacterium]